MLFYIERKKANVKADISSVIARSMFPKNLIQKLYFISPLSWYRIGYIYENVNK